MSAYQRAVLSTLFNQTDSGKVQDLAKQWGCDQDALYSAWTAIHQYPIAVAPDIEQRLTPLTEAN